MRCGRCDGRSGVRGVHRGGDNYNFSSIAFQPTDAAPEPYTSLLLSFSHLKWAGQSVPFIFTFPLLCTTFFFLIPFFRIFINRTVNNNNPIIPPKVWTHSCWTMWPVYLFVHAVNTVTLGGQPLVLQCFLWGNTKSPTGTQAPRHKILGHWAHMQPGPER